MDEQKKLGWPLKVLAAITALWLIAPTLIVIPLSFADRKSFKFPPEGWSLKFYVELFTDPTWRNALLSSLQLGVAVALIATTLGTLVAFALVRGRFPGKNIVYGLVLSPMIVPGIIFAIAALNLFLSWRMVGTFGGFLLAHVAIALPFPVITITAGLRSMDPNLARAASVLGASPFTTFFTVTLPVLLPSVLSGLAFAFMTSFDEVVVSLFIQSPQFRTLPVKMFTSVSTESDPTIAAAATVVVVLSTSVIFISQFGRRSSRNA